MTAIKVPDQHYIGMIMNRSSTASGKDELPLAFMTPDGNDAAAKKRKATVDSWVSSNMRGKANSSPVIMENKPMNGFLLLDVVVHSSRYGSSAKWRVQDPRGFELEISSSNMMFLMKNTIIDKGDILDTCIWGRDGGDNFLLPISSELYTNAVHTSATEKKSVSLRELKIGNNVVLQNGVSGRYLGKLSLLCKSWSKPFPDVVERHIILSDEVKGDAYVAYAYASIKLAEIRGGDVLTPDAALQEFTDRFNSDRKLTVVSSGYMVCVGAMLKEMSFKADVEIKPVGWADSSIFSYNDEYYYVSTYEAKSASSFAKIKVNKDAFLAGRREYTPSNHLSFRHSLNLSNTDNFDKQELINEGAFFVDRYFVLTTSNGTTFTYKG